MPHYRAALAPTTTALPAVRAASTFESAAWVLGAAVMTAVAAQVSFTLPGVPVPFTLQPVAVLASGMVLGAQRGALSQLAYLAMGIAGAAAFAWSPVLLPGVARLMGPTGGFLLAFPLSAFVAGLLADCGWNRGVRAAAAMIAGAVPLYAVGIVWAGAVLPSAPLTSWAPFAAADVVKLALAAPVVAALRRRFAR